MRVQSHLRRSQAFSLPEMLLGVVVLAALVVLLYPAVQEAMARSRSAACLNRLREMGTMLHGVAAEDNGRLRFFRDGNAMGEMRWFLQFKRFAGLSDSEAKKLFGCPSLPTDEVSDWFCYGMRASGSPGKRVSETVKVGNSTSTGALYVLTLAAVQKPSTYLMAADTIGSGGKQTFRIIPPGLYSGAGIQMRHQGRANALFLDGHVEALDLAGLYTAGIEEVLDKDKNPVGTASSGNAPGGAEPEE